MVHRINNVVIRAGNKTIQGVTTNVVKIRYQLGLKHFSCQIKKDWMFVVFLKCAAKDLLPTIWHFMW